MRCYRILLYEGNEVWVKATLERALIGKRVFNDAKCSITALTVELSAAEQVRLVPLLEGAANVEGGWKGGPHSDDDRS